MGKKQDSPCLQEVAENQRPKQLEEVLDPECRNFIYFIVVFPARTVFLQHVFDFICSEFSVVILGPNLAVLRDPMGCWGLSPRCQCGRQASSLLNWVLLGLLAGLVSCRKQADSSRCRSFGLEWWPSNQRFQAGHCGGLPREVSGRSAWLRVR